MLTELMSLKGRVVLDNKTMLRLMANLSPSNLDETSTLYHIGYERAKADLLEVVLSGLGEEYSLHITEKLIRELRSV